MSKIKGFSIRGAQCMVFGAFSKMIHNMPVQAVLKTLELQCRMLEADLENHRLASDEDALSILCFNQFLQTIKIGQKVQRFRSLPLDHLEFYRETITRLVNAKELPASAMEHFEHAFPMVA